VNKKLRAQLSARHCCAVTLGNLSTFVCIRYEAVLFGTDQSVMGWQRGTAVNGIGMISKLNRDLRGGRLQMLKQSRYVTRQLG